jgi:hypothetical protein
MQRACVILYYRLCTVRVCHNVSTLPHKREDFRKTFFGIKLMFWFSLQLFKIFTILRRTGTDIIINVLVYVNYPLFLSDFKVILIFCVDLQKIPKCQFSWKVIQWEQILFHVDGQTLGRKDRETYITKIIVAFRNFQIMPRNTTSVIR